jgi:hypothetical protein
LRSSGMRRGWCSLDLMFPGLLGLLSHFWTPIF